MEGGIIIQYEHMHGWSSKGSAIIYRYSLAYRFKNPADSIKDVSCTLLSTPFLLGLALIT
jgi:hypothetical protein